eukprot:TRINITY_DN360_c0_g1_i1.p1 TRINITY_DN360_c0_g1~~TRINITY_DN360_c0_g1_i1.p1  ORF type:complete len:1017 (+),score=389.84 TRINITY_DN360_c0_g1_i1:191-3241(+)
MADITEDELKRLSCSQLVDLMINPDIDEDAFDLCIEWFLFTYSPEQAWPVVQAHTKDLARKDLFHLVTTKMFQQFESEIFLETVNVFASLPNFEPVMAELGAVKQVAIAMTKDEGSPRSQILGCKVLCGLATDKNVRPFVLRGGILCNRLQAILTRHNANPKVLQICFKTITNLAYHSKSNKHAFLSLPQPKSTVSSPNSGTRLVDLIFESMDRHKGDVDVIGDALVCLRSLMNVNQDTMNRETPPFVLKRVLTLLHAQKENPNLVASSLWVIVLAVTERPGVKNLFNTLRGVSLVLELLEKYKTNDAVTEPGLVLIGLLVKLVNLRKSFLISVEVSKQLESFGAIGEILTETKNERVQRAALKALYRISFCERARQAAGRGNIIERIVAVILKNSNDYPLARIALLFLRSIAKNNEVAILLKTKYMQGVLNMIGALKVSLKTKLSEAEYKPLQDIVMGVEDQAKRREEERKEQERLRALKAAQELAEKKRIEEEDRLHREAMQKAQEEARRRQVILEEEARKQEIERRLERERKAQEARKLEAEREEEAQRRRKEAKKARIEAEKRLAAELEREKEERERARKERLEETSASMKAKQKQQEEKERLKKEAEEQKERERLKNQLREEEEKKKRDELIAIQLAQALEERRKEEARKREEVVRAEAERKAQREATMAALKKAEEERRAEQQAKDEKDRAERMARREEQRRKEKEAKRRAEEREKESLQKKEERRAEKEKNMEEGTKRFLELRRQAVARQEEMAREMLEKKKKALQEKEKELDRQREELKNATYKFALHMHHKNAEYYEEKVESLLNEVHEDTARRITLDQKQHHAFATRREGKPASTRERIESKEAKMYYDFDLARKDRIARRQLTNLRALIGETPKKTEEEEIQKFERRRQQKQAEREEFTVQTLDYQTKTMERALTGLEKELLALKEADAKRQEEEKQRREERAKKRAEMLDETEISANAFLANMAALREKRREERAERIRKQEEEAIAARQAFQLKQQLRSESVV